MEYFYASSFAGLPNFLPSIDTDSVEEKVIPMLEWLQTELRAPPQEVTFFGVWRSSAQAMGDRGSGCCCQPITFSAPGPCLALLLVYNRA